MPNLTVDFSRDSLYYRANRGDYRNAHLVTSASHNAALGINHIALLAPSKPTANLICNVIIETVIGRVYGGVFTNKRVEGISLDIHQREYTDANGAKAYASVIALDSAVTAQVLRYVESRMTVEVIVHNNGAGAGQAQYGHQPQQQVQNQQFAPQQQAQPQFMQQQAQTQFAPQSQFVPTGQFAQVDPNSMMNMDAELANMQ